MQRRTAAPALLLLACLAALLGTAAGARAAEPVGEQYVVHESDGSAGQGARAYARMMAVQSSDTGFVPTVTPPLAGGREACPPRRCIDARLDVPPPTRVSGSMVRVLLPQGYHKHKSRKKRYPVIYMFNGALSAYDAWTRKTLLTSMSKRWGAIFVMPEGGHGELPGMFSDWKDGSFDWETFHIDVVIPWVDRTFRTIRGGRAAVGASMGGFGAMLYAERHPDLFKAVFSISGTLDNSFMAGNTLPPELASTLGLLPPDLRRVWGSPVLDRLRWSAHNPAENASSLKRMTVLVSSGTGFPTNNPDDPVHSGYLEQVVWSTHRTFLGALAASGVPFKARIAQGGVHDWPWFDGPMRWGLPQVIAAAGAR